MKHLQIIYKVEWDKVDDVIFVSESIKQNVLSKISILPKNIHVIPNGINLKKYKFKTTKKRKNIAYAGYLNYKKGPMLLLHAFKAIYDIDNEYKLYIAGKFQDERYVLYFEQMIRDMGLENNVFYEGWQTNLDSWLENKDYIICTSLLESQNMSVMQSMAKGIKPLVHNFVGAKEIYDKKHIWSTISQLVEMVKEDTYASREYREFIEDNYSLEKEYNSIYRVLKNNDEKENNHGKAKENIGGYRKKNPVVTVGVINYNNDRYIDDCLESILKQDYNNIEVIIVDDCSKDGSLEKIKKYEKENESIRGIYHDQNMGNGSYACEDIIRESKGDYFIFIASDDYFPSNEVISNYLNEFEKNKFIDYVYGNLVTVNENKEKIGEYIYTQFMNDEIVKYTFEKMGSGILTMTGMFKKSFYEKNDIKWTTPKENKVAPDTLNSLIAVKNNIKIKHMNKFVLSYRQHDSNGTLNYEERVKSIRSVIDYIIDNFSEEIYAPQINWNGMSDEIRKCSKLFLVGGHYLKTAIYYRDYWCPFGRNLTLKNEEKKKYIRPLLERTKEYFELSINIGDFYKKDIGDMLKEDVFDI